MPIKYLKNLQINNNFFFCYLYYIVWNKAILIRYLPEGTGKHENVTTAGKQAEIQLRIKIVQLQWTSMAEMNSTDIFNDISLAYLVNSVEALRVHTPAQACPSRYSFA
jgi:hypothetical protein